ncbi:hypothetical protein GCM10009808_15510 [Microbacterium sediminicola]|uniref:Uncharacterized protein n=1 Tax=Microbacterium sediminicola TaxID=415210 RepID=A0ABN2I608_9MICO
MITEWLVQLGLGVVSWFVGLFPSDWEVPTEIANLDQMISSFIADFSGLGVWAPWALLITCAVISAGVWSVGLIVKAIRAAIAHIPLVGGAG